MSFLLLREFFLFYIFLFYTYFFFSLDEEFIIFIVISIWLLLLIIFYLKVISIIFIDSLELLTNEYFFFNNKKNMYLSIFKDQNVDFILFNAYLDKFVKVFYLKLHNAINAKIINFYIVSSLFFSEVISYVKLTYKTFLILCYLSTFSYIHKILFFLESEKVKLFNFFFQSYDVTKNKVEFSLLTLEFSKYKKMNLKYQGLFSFFKGNVIRNFDVTETFLYMYFSKILVETLEKKNASAFLKNLSFLHHFFKNANLIANFKKLKK